MRKYAGQSLAVVFSILIIASVIGFALYVRIARDSQRLVEERDSSEANELAETITGILISQGYSNVKNDDALKELFGRTDLDCLYTADGCRVSDMSLERLREFLRRIGLGDVDLPTFDDFDEDYCKFEIAMRYNNENDKLRIEQDDAYSVFLNKVDWSRCNSVQFFMERVNASGFVRSVFYGNHSGDNIEEYKEYQHDDIKGFQYSGSSNRWEPATSPMTFTSSEGTKGGYNVHEVRFKSVGGDSDFSWRLNGDCDVDGYLFVEVGATCGGKYVGKEFILYGNVFAPPIFDYVLFNAIGDLEMEWEEE